MTILAWRFLEKPLLADGVRADSLVYGREVYIGKTFFVPLPTQAWENGLHGSKRLIDALYAAPGSLLCRTEHSGEIVEEGNEIASQYSRVLWMGDIEQLLHEFACDEARRAISARRKEGYNIPVECDNAIKAKLKWLKGAITDEQLAEARTAAQSAAKAVAVCAAKSAAMSAEPTAGDAAKYAARLAAEPATGSAVQNKRLEARVRKFMIETLLRKFTC